MGLSYSTDKTDETGRELLTYGTPDDIVWNTYVSPILSHENLPFIRLTPSIPWQKDILSFAEKAWSSGAHEKTDYALTVRSSLSQITSLLLHNIDSETEHPFTSKTQRDELRIKKTLYFIETHFREQITIEDIAASANISVSTLLRLYHDILHTTPIQHVLKFRLEQISDELLTSPATPIADIAYSCGFNDISYFNRCFLKAYGKTPSEYRKSLV